MRKTLLPLVALSFLMFSCKKDYTCECTSTETMTSPSLNEVSIDNSTTTVKDVTKKFVEDELECYTTESSYTMYDYYIGLDEFFDPIYEDVIVTTRNECTITK